MNENYLLNQFPAKYTIKIIKGTAIISIFMMLSVVNIRFIFGTG